MTTVPTKEDFNNLPITTVNDVLSYVDKFKDYIDGEFRKYKDFPEYVNIQIFIYRKEWESNINNLSRRLNDLLKNWNNKNIGNTVNLNSQLESIQSILDNFDEIIKIQIQIQNAKKTDDINTIKNLTKERKVHVDTIKRDFAKYQQLFVEPSGITTKSRYKDIMNEKKTLDELLNIGKEIVQLIKEMEISSKDIPNIILEIVRTYFTNLLNEKKVPQKLTDLGKQIQSTKNFLEAAEKDIRNILKYTDEDSIDGLVTQYTTAKKTFDSINIQTLVGIKADIDNGLKTLSKDTIVTNTKTLNDKVTEFDESYKKIQQQITKIYDPLAKTLKDIQAVISENIKGILEQKKEFRQQDKIYEKSLQPPLYKQFDEQLMNSLRPLFEERALRMEEIAKDKQSYDELKQKVKENMLETANVEHALKTVGNSVASLPIPSNTPPEGWQVVQRMINGELAARGIDLKLEEKTGGKYRNHGGDASMKPSKNATDGQLSPKENAKKQLQTLDTVKKELRGVLDALDTIKSTYTKTFDKLFSAKKLEETKEKYEGNSKTTSGAPDPATATAAPNPATARPAPAAATTGPSKPNERNNRDIEVSKDEQNIVAQYKTVQEDGLKWVNEIQEIIKVKKKSLETIQDLLKSIFDTEPSNKKYIDYAMEVKLLLEGDYNKITKSDSGKTKTDVDAKDEKAHQLRIKEETEKKGVLSQLQTIAQEARTMYENAERLLKPIALSVNQRAQLQLEQIKNKRYDNRGYSNNTRVVDGGVSTPTPGTKDAPNLDEPILDDFPVIINVVSNSLTDTILKRIVSDLDIIYMRQNNPIMANAVSEPSLISMLYNEYQDRQNRVGQFVAAKELATQMHNNALIPREVLAVTSLDKTVFVFVALIIRLLALFVTEAMINRGWIKRMSTALTAFVGFYLLFFIIFVVIVNFDTYRMRIVFNYVNFHANSGMVYMHIGVLCLFSLLIYILMTNINFPIKGLKQTAISEEEQANLVYRLEVLTMIIWIVLMIMVAVSK